MLAAELRLAGVRPVVLERQPQLRGHPERQRPRRADPAAAALPRPARALHDGRHRRAPSPTPIYPFGGVHLDLTQLADPPLKGMQLRHPSVERLLDEPRRRARRRDTPRARGRRREPGRRRGDGGRARPRREVRGPGRYLVGGDGARAGSVGWPASRFQARPTRRSTGWPSSPSPIGRAATATSRSLAWARSSGVHRTEHGVFASGRSAESDARDDRGRGDRGRRRRAGDAGRTRRQHPPDPGATSAGEPQRLTRYQFDARQAERYRDGAFSWPGTRPTSSGHRQRPQIGVNSVNLGWNSPPSSRAGRRRGCWTATTTNATSPAGARCSRPRRRSAAAGTRRGRRRAAGGVPGSLTDEQPQRRLAASIAATTTATRLRRPLVGTFAKDLRSASSRGLSSRPRRPGRPARGGPRLGGPRRRSHVVTEDGPPRRY